MGVDGKTLKDHIQQASGLTFVESASGWKGRCPFEKNASADSFLVFNSPEGDFYCFSCKAKGGLDDFDRFWTHAEAKQRRAELEAQILRAAEPQPSAAPPAATAPSQAGASS